MADRKPGIVFMGTPDFAVPSLEILIQNNYPVKAVVTAVDKPSGRGLKIRESAVKRVAVAHGIPVIQPVSLKNNEFVGQLRDFNAELFVVVAFRMLPRIVWNIPPMGTINLHASLLPSYRGAAPINHAIINGEKISGVTTFIIEQEIDKGKILFQEKTDIADDETAGSLHDRLMLIGARVLLKTVKAMSEGFVIPLSQDEITVNKNLPVAPKISKNDCRIDWSSSAEKIYDFVRGLSPYPAAWTFLNSGDKVIKLKIFKVEKIQSPHTYSSGQVMKYDDNIIIATGEDAVVFKYIQPEGRKVMTGSEFLRGFRFDNNAFCI